MDRWEIILAILSSSLFAAILSGIINLLIQNKNYKNDYYKKLIEKRIIAYELLEILNRRLSDFVVTEKASGHIHLFMVNTNLFSQFRKMMFDAMEYNFYLDEETNKKLGELNVFIINEIFYLIDREDLNEDQKSNILIEFGDKNFEILNSFKRDLKNMVYKDLKTLHKIDKFLNQKI